VFQVGALLGEVEVDGLEFFLVLELLLELGVLF
jgi:hypothetical protein